MGHRGGRWHERQEEAAVIGIGLQDGGESKDGAVRGIFNTEQGVLAAVTCTKEKEQSGSSTHGGKGHKKKSGNESKLKNCSLGVTSPGVVGQEAPSWDGKVTEEFTRNIPFPTQQSLASLTDAGKFSPH